jgi:hypothetical protein
MRVVNTQKLKGLSGQIRGDQSLDTILQDIPVTLLQYLYSNAF